MKGWILMLGLALMGCSAGKTDQNPANLSVVPTPSVQTDSLVYFPEEKELTELKTEIPEKLLLLNDENNITLCCDTGEPEAVWINHKGENATIRFVRATETKEYLIVKLEETDSAVVFNLIPHNAKEGGNSSNICKMKLKLTPDAVSIASLLDATSEKGTDYKLVGYNFREKYQTSKSKDCQ